MIILFFFLWGTNAMFKIKQNCLILICILGLGLSAHAMENQNPNEIIVNGSEDQIIALLARGFDHTEYIRNDKDQAGNVLYWATIRDLIKVFDWIKIRRPNSFSTTQTGLNLDLTPLAPAAAFDKPQTIAWVVANYPNINLNYVFKNPGQAGSPYCI